VGGVNERVSRCTFLNKWLNFRSNKSASPSSPFLTPRTKTPGARNQFQIRSSGRGIAQTRYNYSDDEFTDSWYLSLAGVGRKDHHYFHACRFLPALPLSLLFIRFRFRSTVLSKSGVPTWQGLNDYRTDDATDNFQHSKHLEQKLKNPVKTANPSNAWNDEYDRGSISDDDLPNSARRSKGHGITDGNFDFDDFPVRGGKSGSTFIMPPKKQVQNSIAQSEQRGPMQTSYRDAHNANSVLSPYPVQTGVCRQFWKAGDYDVRSSSKRTFENGMDHVRVHPKFLHPNATSHKWALGAIAELLDNAVDEIQNGATFVNVDKITNPRDNSPALLVQDDGGGMDPDCMRQCMSLGYSRKNINSTIGQYGNGFKTSPMRLGVMLFNCAKLGSQQ
jgi:hypothetical protein